MVERLTRGGLLARLGGLLAAASGVGAWRASSAPAAGTVSCVLTPEMTEGPYYITGEKLRRNITDGHPGARLDLALSVVDATTCKPIKGAVRRHLARRRGRRLLGLRRRRVQPDVHARRPEDERRPAWPPFQTVYPGWYQGRAVHIHVKVHVGGNVVHTGQLFFSDTLTDSVYKRLAVQPPPEPRHAERPGHDLPRAARSRR